MHYSIVSIVLAIFKNSQELDRTLQSMLNPNQLHGIQHAVDLLVDAYQQQQKIVIVGDFDADGATSTALSVLALRMLGFTEEWNT